MFCPNCGKNNDSNSKFCVHCGAKLKGEKYNSKLIGLPIILGGFVILFLALYLFVLIFIPHINGYSLGINLANIIFFLGLFFGVISLFSFSLFVILGGLNIHNEDKFMQTNTRYLISFCIIMLGLFFLPIFFILILFPNFYSYLVGIIFLILALISFYGFKILIDKYKLNMERILIALLISVIISLVFTLI